MTHEEKRERRKKIAARAEAGVSMSALCRQFGVGTQVVREACHEYAVSLPLRRRAPVDRPVFRQLQIIGRLLRGMSGTSIANELHCSKQYVSLARKAARAAGIKV